MKLADARMLAETIQWALAPGCKEIRIAGSIRRLKPEPGDIEIVAVPDLRPPKPVFGQTKYHDTTLDAILDLRLGSPDGLYFNVIKNGPKYKQFWVSMDNGASFLVKLDLFLATPQNFVTQFVIRTGPSEFSNWIVTPRAKNGCLPDGYRVQDGAMVVDQATGQPVQFEEEIDFLNFLGIGWIEPYARKAHWGYWRGKVEANRKPALEATSTFAPAGGGSYITPCNIEQEGF